MSQSSSLGWRLFCQPVDDNGRFLTPVLRVDASPDDTVGHVQKLIYEKLSKTSLLVSKDLRLWKLTKDISGATDMDTLQEEISQLGFPDLEQLWPARELSVCWPEGPKTECIHILAWFPRNGNAHISFCRISPLTFLLATICSIIPAFASNKPRRSGSRSISGGKSDLVFLMDEAIVCRREVTVTNLWKKVRKYRFVWVQGTPGSGKTVLAQLLKGHIEINYPNARVIAIPFWDEKDRKDWIAGLDRRGFNFKKLDPHQKKLTVLIFDEAQTTYSDNGLWISFFKNMPVMNKNLHVVLFASHGVVSTTLDTPRVEVADRQRITLQAIDYNDGLPPVGLLFTWDEFVEVVNRRYKDRCCFDTTFLQGLFEITRGHIGAIHDCLVVIEAQDAYKRIKCAPQLGKFTWNTFKEKIPPQVLLDMLGNGANIFSRGIPKDHDLCQPDVFDALSSVIENQSVEVETEEKDIAKSYLYCSKKGWLHSDITQRKGASRTTYFFASPLHQWYVEWKLFFEDGNHPGISNEPTCTLFDFIKEIISRFDPTRLISNERRVGAGGIQRPPEAVYQDEFYRCSHDYSPGSLLSFPEFGVANGRVDFYFKSKRWGIELLRESDQLTEHSVRFSQSGVRGTKLPIDEYILLDCRTSSPQKPHPSLENLYHVVFEEGYTVVDILDNKCQQIERFSLIRS